MGGSLSDICSRTEVCSSNENLILEFQQKALSFPTNINSKRRLSYGTVTKSFSYQDTDRSSSKSLELEKVECVCSSDVSKQFLEKDDIPVIVGNNVSCKDSLSETHILERIRSNAIELEPTEAPQGKFVREKQFYVRKSYGDWEIVCLESWNSWNATWQVKGGDGKSFPAAPIALKSKEEYEFLSRNRVVNSRSFGSLSEAASIKLLNYLAVD